MIRGVRRPDEVEGLGLSRRLRVRVGALLKKSVEITPAALEGARPGSPLEQLLLDPALLEQAATLDEASWRKLVAQHLKSSGDEWAVQTGKGGLRVLCLREELEAEGGWGADEEPRAEPGSALAQRPADAPLARTSGTRSAVNDSEALFSRRDLDRFRLKLVTAAAAAERIEALRTLAHAPLAAPEKAEALFCGLEDRETAVRGEAAGLLFVLGVADEVCSSLQALCQGEPAARRRAIERLTKRLSTPQPEWESGAVCICVLAGLKAQSDPAESALLLELLRVCAPALLRTPPRLAELVRVAIAKAGIAGSGGEALRVPAARLLRALCQADYAILRPLLQEEREKSTDTQGEALLLQALMDYEPAGTAEEPALLASCASFLARDTEESRDSRAIGLTLSRRGEPALRAMLEVFPKASAMSQKYLLRLIDDLVRYQSVSLESRERAAGIVLQAVESGNRGLRMTAMHIYFITDPGISEALREKMAAAILASMRDFGFRSDIEIAEEIVARLGLPAIRPLLERLGAERPADVREEAIRILGDLALQLKAPKGQMKRTAEEVTGILRKLQALAAETSPAPSGALYVAMGKLVSSPAASAQAAEVVSRHLLQAVSWPTSGVALGALEGLSWIAASRRAKAPLIGNVTGLLCRAMEEARDDLATQSREVDGQTVIEIQGEGGVVDVLPVVLSGISRIARSPTCPQAVSREMLQLLLAQWKRILSGELVWGPGNSMRVVRTLEEMGSCDRISDALVMEILKALAPRLAQVPVMQSVSGLLAARDTEFNAAAALSVGLAVSGRRGADGRYDPEDRAEILKALARLASRKHLGGSREEAREKARRFRQAAIEDLFSGAKDLVSGAYEGLGRIQLSGTLSPESQRELDRRLSEFHALAMG